MRKRSGLLGGIGAVLSLIIAGPAAAALPTGNLLANPGAEDGPGAADSTQAFVPRSWQASPGYPLVPTAVRYGAPGGFLTAAQGLAFNGGSNFFAGGPCSAATNPDACSSDDDSEPYRVRGVYQFIDIPADAVPDVQSGHVIATVTGCLGGYGSQDDTVDLREDFTTAGGIGFQDPGFADSLGPSAADRDGQTKLMPRSASAPLDKAAQRIEVSLNFVRRSGAGTYSDGYADNIGLWLTPQGAPVPAPNCGTVGGSPGGGGGGGSGSPGAGSPVAAPFLVKAAAGSAHVSGSRSTIGVPLACGGHDAPCAGSVGLSVPGLPRASSVKLGSASFSIAPGATQTVRVRLGRSAKKRLAALSSRRLQRLRVTATVTMGAASSSFPLRLK